MFIGPIIIKTYSEKPPDLPLDKRGPDEEKIARWAIGGNHLGSESPPAVPSMWLSI